MEYKVIRSEEYLAHHGILGQKWGVRRYQNYDGSLTRAGVKRYEKSREEYEKADTRYKTAKQNKSDKTELTNARLARKTAKRRLDKDYKHLRQDKLADQGKELYSRGKTITGNGQVTGILTTIGSMALSAAAYNYKTQIVGGQEVTKALLAAGVATMGIAGAKELADNYQNKRLRAYYGHTSNY